MCTAFQSFVPVSIQSYLNLDNRLLITKISYIVPNYWFENKKDENDDIVVGANEKKCLETKYRDHLQRITRNLDAFLIFEKLCLLYDITVGVHISLSRMDDLPPAPGAVSCRGNGFSWTFIRSFSEGKRCFEVRLSLIYTSKTGYFFAIKQKQILHLFWLIWEWSGSASHTQQRSRIILVKMVVVEISTASSGP